MFNMIDTFNKFLSENQLVSLADKLLLAVSGGSDSMAMLELFRLSQFKIGVIHLNHGMRAKESDKDENLCESYCRKNQIPFFSKKVDLKHIKSNFQEEARKIRFDYFNKVMHQEGYNLIATAHHKNDQVENFFLRINRQAGLKGLGGIKLRIGNLIHPMLFASKSEILEFLSTNEVPFREDQSNLESKYQRNFIRNEVLPKIMEKFPSFDENLNASIAHLSEYNSLFQSMFSELKPRLLSEHEGLTTIDLENIKQIDNPKFILFLLLKEWQFNRTQSDNIHDARSGTSIDLNGFTFLKDRNEILIKRLYEGVAPNLTIEELNKVYSLSDGKSLKIEKAETVENTNSSVIYVQSDKVHFPLKVRNRLPGDIFYPAGMGMKRKKLKKYLVDKKLNNFDKKDVSILTNALDEIIWVVGFRQDERFVPTSSSAELLRISYTVS